MPINISILLHIVAVSTFTTLYNHPVQTYDSHVLEISFHENISMPQMK